MPTPWPAGAGPPASASPFRQATLPKRGFYRTFQEFRDNAPSEANYPFAIEHIAHPGKRWEGHDEVLAAYLRTDAQHQRTLVSRTQSVGTERWQRSC